VREALVRRAVAGDAADAAALLRETFTETFGHTYRPEDLARFLDGHYGAPIQAAEIDDPDADFFVGAGPDGLLGVATGAAMALPIAHAAGAWELKRLYLRSAARGAGLADALIESVMAAGRARGAREIYLGVWSENVRAQRFYARFGFEKVGEYLFEVGEARDEEWILRAAL
jgi:ribosomal protein S18 acetylase RimI-like enzyme